MQWCVRGKAEEFRGLHVATGEVSPFANGDKGFSPLTSPSFLKRKEGQKNLNIKKETRYGLNTCLFFFE